MNTNKGTPVQDSPGNDMGRVMKARRLMSELTLRELAHKSGVSSSHLGRIERGERFPSARILRKVAQPLGFQEETLLIYGGYLSPPSAGEGDREQWNILGGLDPYVASVLSQEPVEVQRTAVAILTILRNIARK